MNGDWHIWPDSIESRDAGDEERSPKQSNFNFQHSFSDPDSLHGWYASQSCNRRRSKYFVSRFQDKAGRSIWLDLWKRIYSQQSLQLLVVKLLVLHATGTFLIGALPLPKFRNKRSMKSFHCATNHEESWSYCCARMYITLLQRINTSPSEPANLLSIHSSVSASWEKLHISPELHEFSKRSITMVWNLQVHVRIHRNKETLVFHAPLQLDHHGFAGQLIKEGLRVDRGECHVSVSE